MATPEQVKEALRHVIDPELGVNVVDLGLVYRVELGPNSIRVALTMTSPACPLFSYLQDQSEAVLRQHFPGMLSVTELVWEPPWSPEMMSAEARQQLGWGGSK